VGIDVHQHLWPEQLIRALERRAEPPRLRGGRLELAVEGSFDVDLRQHELAARLALLDRYELDLALVSLAPTLETEGATDLVDAYHEGITEVVAGSGGRIAALAADRPRAGFAGVCISAGALVAGIDPLYAALEREGGLLFVHPGPPGAKPPPRGPAWWAAGVEYTAQMQAAYLTWLERDAARFPAVDVVFAILAGGAPIQLERLRSRGVEVRSTLHPNGYFDTSSYGRRALELCLSTYGVTQLVFGSDAPVIEPELTLQSVREFGEAVTEIILRETPGRLLSTMGS
jgi:predicted TIM-barrel fold metal-dependent hydrolase